MFRNRCTIKFELEATVQRNPTLYVYRIKFLIGLLFVLRLIAHRIVYVEVTLYIQITRSEFLVSRIIVYKTT